MSLSVSVIVISSSIYVKRQENGYIESFNGKLRDELLNREIFITLEEANVLIGQWWKEYNQVRPHRALGYRSPAPVTILTKVTS